MIRVATVFSGIGAIEHALQRMGVKHEIVFACDNGDVDILSKEIEINVGEIEKEINNLSDRIQKIGLNSNDDLDYKKQLAEGLHKCEEEFLKVNKKLKSMEDHNMSMLVMSLLQDIVENDDLKKSRYKEYSNFLSELKKEKSKSGTILESLKYILEIYNDYKKDNDPKLLMSEKEVEFISADNIKWVDVKDKLRDAYSIFEHYEGKKIIKKVRDISERLGMLHEKIESFYILKELSTINKYTDKKKYVDKLYEKKASQNKVRESYLANYGIDEERFHWNVSFLDGHQYKDKVDLFVGGSPCQSFSLVGKQRGLEDTRGTLFYEYARLVNEIKPKVFIYENVKALLSNDGGKTWETIQQIFADLDYTWYQDVLNAKDYGIPQNRERVFVVGFRNDLILENKFSFPEPVKLDKTMQDFLLDNVSGKYYLPEKGVDFVTREKNLVKRFTQIDGDVQLCQKKNQQFNWHGDFVFVEENNDKEQTMQDLGKYFLSEKVRKYVLATGTKGFYSKPKTDLEIARPLLTTMHKMHRAGVDNYVTTDGRLRKLTPRECLRLMGFCDSFKIVVSDTSMYQQAGNSIVVDVLIAIMGKILECYKDCDKE